MEPTQPPANTLSQPITTPTQATNTQPHQYYIANQAYEHLLTLAPLPRALSATLNTIASHNPTVQDWIDARPSYLISASEERMRTASALPVWSERYDTRRPHTLRLTPTTIVTLAALAIHHQIGRDASILRNNPYTHIPQEIPHATAPLTSISPYTLAAHILEAIGLTYLAPANPLPPNLLTPSLLSPQAPFYSSQRRATHPTDYFPNGTIRPRPPPSPYRQRNGRL